MIFKPSGLAAAARDGSRKHALVSDAVQPPVKIAGSRTKTLAFDELIDWEKSPARSSAVGTVTKRGSCGFLWCGFSIEKKKKAFSLSRLGPPSPKLGSGMGPPKFSPGRVVRF